MMSPLAKYFVVIVLLFFSIIPSIYQHSLWCIRKQSPVKTGVFLSQVDYSYPPLISGGEVHSTETPKEWKNLPSLAIPDGAHNYVKGKKTNQNCCA